MLGSFIQKSRQVSQKRGENASTQTGAQWDEPSIHRKLGGDLGSVTPEENSEGGIITILQMWKQRHREVRWLGPGPIQVEKGSSPALSGPELSPAPDASGRTRGRE